MDENPARTPEAGEARSSGQVPASRIQALVHLLGDDDPKICSVAWAHLEKIGEPALSFVESATRQTGDERVQIQAARFLKEWSRREVFARWVAFCRKGQLDLEEGAFLLAETEYPGLDVGSYRKTLDGYAHVLEGRLSTARSTEDAVKKINAFLFSDLNFRGNAAEHDDPENSYLNRVLDLKRGIPISLSAIYLLVARRLGVTVHGVGMPQHFLLKYKGSGGEVFVDTFHQGKLLTARDCARFLAEARIPFHEEYFRAVTDAEMLTRMLGNLLRIYLEMKDQRRHDRITAMLKLLS